MPAKNHRIYTGGQIKLAEIGNQSLHYHLVLPCDQYNDNKYRDTGERIETAGLAQNEEGGADVF